MKGHEPLDFRRKIPVDHALPNWLTYSHAALQERSHA